MGILIFNVFDGGQDCTITKFGANIFIIQNKSLNADNSFAIWQSIIQLKEFTNFQKNQPLISYKLK